MTSAREQRRIRLKNDYQSMQNIVRPWLKWRALKGEPPYVEAYEIDVDLRTIVGPEPTYSSKHKIVVELPGTYPHKSAPIAIYQGNPKPFHPNWFTDGRWCYGTWLVHEGLGQYIVRMFLTLQYDSQITNERSPANSSANDWYLSNRNSGLFPCDTTALPDPSAPTTGKIKIRSGAAGRKFVIR